MQIKKGIKSKIKRIGIDARFFGIHARGLGRYTVQLLKNLEAIDSFNQYFVYLRKENFDDYRPQKRNFHKRLADVSWYSLKEQLVMPYLLYKDRLDIAHFPHFNFPILYFNPFIITIHDLILLKYPTKKATTLHPIFYKLKEWSYKIVLRQALKRAKKIIAVSLFTRNDIVKNFPWTQKRIQVVLEGVPKLKTETIKSFRLKKFNLLTTPYLLYIGAGYPHKNLKRLILAFNLLKKKPQFKKLQLVLTGGDDYFYQQLKMFVQRRKIKNVSFTGLVSEKDLQVLLKKAKIFVFPSLYEGFGLPVLEAMACNVPVVCSNTSSIPEVAGSGAYYFNPESIKEIAFALRKVLMDDKLRDKLTQKGRERVKKFSWEKMAQKILKIYQI